MFRKYALLTGLLSLFICPSSTFGMTVARYEETQESQTTLYFLFGLGAGMTWSNAALKVTGSPMLYCTPKGVAFNVSNYKQILDDYIQEMRAKNNVSPDTPIGALLVEALVKTFPCPPIGGG